MNVPIGNWSNQSQLIAMLNDHTESYRSIIMSTNLLWQIEFATHVKDKISFWTWAEFSPPGHRYFVSTVEQTSDEKVSRFVSCTIKSRLNR